MDSKDDRKKARNPKGARGKRSTRRKARKYVNDYDCEYVIDDECESENDDENKCVNAVDCDDVNDDLNDENSMYKKVEASENKSQGRERLKIPEAYWCDKCGIIVDQEDHCPSHHKFMKVIDAAKQYSKRYHNQGKHKKLRTSIKQPAKRTADR